MLKLSFCHSFRWDFARLFVVADGSVDMNRRRFGWGWVAYHHDRNCVRTHLDWIPQGMRDCEGHGIGPALENLVISPTMCELVALIQACHGVINNIKGGLRCLSIELYGGNLLADQYMHLGLDADDALFRQYPHHQPLAKLARAAWKNLQSQVRKALPGHLAQEVTFHVGRRTRGRDGRALKVATGKANTARELGQPMNPVNWESMREPVWEALVASQASAVQWHRQCLEANRGGNSGGKGQFNN